MSRRTSLVGDLARAIYEREPVLIGGYEHPFSDAPSQVRRRCYDQAQAAVDAMRCTG